MGLNQGKVNADRRFVLHEWRSRSILQVIRALRRYKESAYVLQFNV